MNKKISELNAAASLTGSELVAVVQSGETVKTTAQDIADLASGGGDVELLETVVTVNTASILTLFSTPIEIVAAPGAGKYIDVYNVTVENYKGSVNFLNFSGLLFYYTDYAGDIVTSVPVTASQNFIYKPQYYYFYNIGILNKGITIQALTQNPTTGNGYIKVRIVYRVITQ